MKHLILAAAAAGVVMFYARGGFAAEAHATMRLATPAGVGEPVATVTISDSTGGAVFKLALKGLPPGTHGFHVHERGSCDASMANGQPVPAGAAGGHLDPAGTGKHEGPSGSGHLGDLPAVQVASDGTADETLTAPRITDVSALKGRALMIHVGGDTYSDQPLPLGGGGARLACGAIE